MEMTESEIVKSYSSAKDKKVQLRILADLNDCTVDKIKDIVSKGLGIDRRTLALPTNRGIGRRGAFADGVMKRTTKVLLDSGVPFDDIAKECGCSAAHLRNIQYGNGCPSIELIVRIARFGNVTTDYLLGVKDDIR